jgi:hypothetical protein
MVKPFSPVVECPHVQIMIHRDGKDYGPYPVEQVRELLTQGIFTQDDQAWVEGGSEWTTLRELFSPTPAATKKPAKINEDPPTPGQTVPDSNPPNTKMLVIGLVAFLLLALISFGIYDVLRESVAPLLTLVNNKSDARATATTISAPTDAQNVTLPATSFFAITYEENGDTLTATMMIQDSHDDQLCDKVMGEIYSMAIKHSADAKLKLIVQAVGKKEVNIDIPDLDSVRQYPTPDAYIRSEHRSFIAGLLTAP